MIPARLAVVIRKTFSRLQKMYQKSVLLIAKSY
jgi:hypothetical protein